MTKRIRSQTPSAKQKSSLSLTPRDLINIGIFTSLYFVALLITVILGIVNPLMLTIAIFASLFTGAIVYMVYLRRTKKFGMVSIMALLIGGLMIVASHPFITFVVIVIAGVAGDWVATKSKIPAKWRNVVSYVVFTLWYIGPLIPLLIAGVTLPEDGSRSHAASFAPFVTGVGFAIFVLLVIVVGGVSAIIAERLVKKHFKRAGVI